MPRKTRKQKERAKIHLVKREFIFSFDGATSTKLTTEPVKNSDLSRQTIDVRFELSDLIKTLMLAIGVFVLELVIYFVWLS